MSSEFSKYGCLRLCNIYLLLAVLFQMMISEMNSGIVCPNHFLPPVPSLSFLFLFLYPKTGKYNI